MDSASLIRAAPPFTSDHTNTQQALSPHTYTATTFRRRNQEKIKKRDKTERQLRSDRNYWFQFPIIFSCKNQRHGSRDKIVMFEICRVLELYYNHNGTDFLWAIVRKLRE